MRPWCAVALLACAVPRGGRASFVAIDPSAHAARLGDDYEWAVRSVPFAELAADDDVVAAFYYRWRVLRKHVTWTGAPDGYVITEFLREVSWAGLHNTIPAAAGHHLREARWLRNATAASDYARFWFCGHGRGARELHELDRPRGVGAVGARGRRGAARRRRARPARRAVPRDVPRQVPARDHAARRRRRAAPVLVAGRRPRRDGGLDLGAGLPADDRERDVGRGGRDRAHGRAAAGEREPRRRVRGVGQLLEGGRARAVERGARLVRRRAHRDAGRRRAWRDALPAARRRRPRRARPRRRRRRGGRAGRARRLRHRGRARHGERDGRRARAARVRAVVLRGPAHRAPTTTRARRADRPARDVGSALRRGRVRGAVGAHDRRAAARVLQLLVGARRHVEPELVVVRDGARAEGARERAAARRRRRPRRRPRDARARASTRARPP